MNLLQHKIKLPFAIFAGSLIFIILLVLLTNPLNNIIFVSLFFIALFVLLNSAGFLITGIQRQIIESRVKSRIILVSTFIVIFLMFRSAKALSLLDGLLLLIFSAGLFFYLSRR